MKITLDTEKEIILVKEIKTKITEITIRQVVDIAEQKTVQAYTNEIGMIILWQGEEYDAIGQWTDTDVINKIKSL